jgi:hypothetical protein
MSCVSSLEKRFGSQLTRCGRGRSVFKIIVATGLVGWTAIVTILWKLTDFRRHQLCQQYYWDSCNAHFGAKQDTIVAIGLTVGLAYILACMCAYALIRARPQRQVTYSAGDL